MKQKGSSELSPKYYRQLPDILKTSNSPRPQLIKLNRNHSESSYLKTFVSKDAFPKEFPIIPGKSIVKSQLNPISNYISEAAIKETFVKNSSFEALAMGSPSDRKEVQKLIEWLDQKLQKIVDTSYQPSQLFEIANEIYSICLTEVIRQVSVHCKERGYLISRVWNAYRHLFEESLIRANQRLTALEETHVIEKEKLQHSFNVQSDLLSYQVTEITEEKNFLIDALENNRKLIRSYEATIKSLNNKLQFVQERYRSVKNEMLNYREETRILRIKFENLGVEDSSSKKKPWMFPKRFKRKNKKNIEKKVEEDPLLNIQNIDENLIFPVLMQYEKDVEFIFKGEDFRDQCVSTADQPLQDAGVQTSVEDLCGETIAIKKRTQKFNLSTFLSLKVPRPIYFPEHHEYSKKSLSVESQGLQNNPEIPEMKKKHIRVRKLLTSVKEVMEK